jgi:hypothetical protein
LKALGRAPKKRVIIACCSAEESRGVVLDGDRDKTAR